VNGEGEDGCTIGKTFNTFCEAVIESYLPAYINSEINSGTCCTNIN